jgi:hypothetical protein
MLGRSEKLNRDWYQDVREEVDERPEKYNDGREEGRDVVVRLGGGGGGGVRGLLSSVREVLVVCTRWVVGGVRALTPPSKPLSLR